MARSSGFGPAAADTPYNLVSHVTNVSYPNFPPQISSFTVQLIYLCIFNALHKPTLNTGFGEKQIEGTNAIAMISYVKNEKYLQPPGSASSKCKRPTNFMED